MTVGEAASPPAPKSWRGAERIETYNAGDASLTRRFLMGEIEVTNTLMAVVLQWAKGRDYIVDTAGAHNNISTSRVRYGN